MPHHVVQRGNRRQQVFFRDQDKQKYLEILKKQKDEHGLKIWSYCLMNNHVHLIVVPEKKESLALGIGETHKRYTRMINFREEWRGYLWEGRFKSFVLDEKYLYAAVKYVERNPVRAGIVKKAEEYAWSSARFRVSGEGNEILSDYYLLDEVKDWRVYLQQEDEDKNLSLIRRHGATGRPWGSSEFMDRLARKFGVDLRPKKPGPKPGN
ncbi:MAG: transposase [Candidatus Omnitrophica bacterium]|nr:transposase [Candidatus Omnitrophota bacterium]